MKGQVNVRVSDATHAKLDWLAKCHGTQAEAVAVAIDRMYREERSTMNEHYESIHLFEDNAGGLLLMAKDANGPAKGWLLNDPASEAPDGFVSDARDLLAGHEDAWTLDTVEGDALYDTLDTLKTTDRPNGLSYLAIYDARGLHCRRTDGADGLYDEPGRAGREYLRTDVAALVYSAADGADHKARRAETVQAIYEWLADGDDGNGATIADLAAEWREYSADADA